MGPKKKKIGEEADVAPPASSNISKKELSPVRENAEALKGHDRRAAIQTMLSWLKSHSKGDSTDHQDNAAALNAYKGIEDEASRNRFTAQFYKARNSDNSMKWAKQFTVVVTHTEECGTKCNENYLSRPRRFVNLMPRNLDCLGY